MQPQTQLVCGLPIWIRLNQSFPFGSSFLSLIHRSMVYPMDTTKRTNLRTISTSLNDMANERMFRMYSFKSDNIIFIRYYAIRTIGVNLTKLFRVCCFPTRKYMYTARLRINNKRCKPFNLLT